MRDEIGQWLLPGVAVGVEDTSDETADNMNSTLKELSSQLEMPEIEPLEISEPDVPEQPEINVSTSKPIQLEELTIEPLEASEQSEIIIDSPEIEVLEPQPTEFESSETVLPDNKIFTQQIELLREFYPKNSVPELDGGRITAEIQSQLDEIMVTLNADNFISRFEAILSGMRNAAVPQYSEVYGQIRSVPERVENNHQEIPINTQFSPKISVFIGDTEIKDFVISAIDEANAVSGGVSV